MLRPGATIGIFGGGQLGRMMAMAAAELGFRCIGYAPEGDNVADSVSADFFANTWHDRAALAAFSAQCDAVTWEFENVPVETVAAMDAERLYPPARALEVAQDRLEEKRFIRDLGGQPAPFEPVDTREDLARAIERLGAPGILKTRRDGYDGKGQQRIASVRDAEGVSIGAVPMVYEGMVEFSYEFSVILARGRDGAMVFYDSPVNVHEDGILRTSTLPAPEELAAQIDTARDLARDAADALDYVGVLTLEFFATAQGPVFNEMAPRVHNSGHWTIEGAATSQFANHIRAVAGLPLGDTATTARSVTMENLIGRAMHGAHAQLAEAGTSVHLYGKARALEGRKMGHLTRLAR